MCITFFNITLQSPSPSQPSPYKFIQVFNREEDADRPTQPLAFWEEDSNILAGRDKRFGGTWLGLNIKTGNYAFLTNIDLKFLPILENKEPLGRGKIIWDFLRTDFFEKRGSLEDEEGIKGRMSVYIGEIEKEKHRYGGFNLVIANLKIMYFKHVANDKLNEGISDIEKGSYVMTNNPFKDLYKLARDCLGMFEEVVAYSKREEAKEDDVIEKLQGVAREGFRFPYTWLEKYAIVTGKGIEIIKSAIWATKTSTVILMDNNNDLRVVEMTYDENLKVNEKVLFKLHIEAEF